MFRPALVPVFLLACALALYAPASVQADLPNHIWSRALPEIAGGTIDMSVSPDPNGGLVVAGMSHHITDKFVCWRLAEDGTVTWTRTFATASSPLSRIRVVVDAASNVLLTGTFLGMVNFGGGPLVSAGATDIFFVKLDPNGNHVFSRRFGGAQNDQGMAIQFHGGGMTTIAGVQYGVNFGGATLPNPNNNVFSMFSALFDGQGAHVASRAFGPGATVGAVTDMHIDFGAWIYMTGYYSGNLTGVFTNPIPSSEGSNDVVIMVYRTNGVSEWGGKFGLGGDDRGLSIDVAPNGEIVMAGTISGPTYVSPGQTHCGTSFFVERFTDYGLTLFRRASALYCGADSWGTSVAATWDGGAIVTGYLGEGEVDFGAHSITSHGGDDAFIVKYDANGSDEWAYRLGDAANQRGFGVAATQAGNAYATGAFNGNLSACAPTVSSALYSGYVLKLGAGLLVDDTAPLVPTNLTWDGTTLRWTAASDPEGGAVSYRVYPSGGRANGQEFLSCTGTSLLFDESQSGALFLSVSALDCNDNESAWSGRIELYPTQTGPAAPTNLVYTGAELTWTAPLDNDIAYYAVHGSPTANFDDPARRRLGNTPTLSFNTSTFGPAYYLVRAIDTSGNWGDVAVIKDTVAPPTPTGLTFDGNHLWWNGSTDPGFSIFKAYASMSPVLDGSATPIAMTTKWGTYVPAAQRLAYYHLRQTDKAGNNSLSITVPGTAGVALTAEPAPRAYPLSITAMPNPFRGEATVDYSLPSAGRARVRVYDVRGALVATLDDEQKPAGAFQTVWGGRYASGAQATAGVYFLRLEFDGKTQTRKLVLLK